MWVGMIVSGINRHGGVPQNSKRKGEKGHLDMMGFKPPASEALNKLNDFYGLADGTPHSLDIQNNIFFSSATAL